MKHVLKSADPVLSISKKIWGNFKLNVKPKFIKCGIWYSQQIVIFFVEVLNLYPKIAKTLLYINLSQFYYLVENIFCRLKWRWVEGGWKGYLDVEVTLGPSLGSAWTPGAPGAELISSSPICSCRSAKLSVWIQSF